MFVNLKGAPIVLIFLIRVIRLDYCKVCKDSSVRGGEIDDTLQYTFAWVCFV